MRRALVVSLASALIGGTGAGAAGAAAAGPPPPATPFVVLSSHLVHSGDQITVTPSAPCVPPSAAHNPVARVGLGSARTTDFILVTTTEVPVAGDGRWSAKLTVSGTGNHDVFADCLSSSTAEGSYAHYESALVGVATTSNGYWLAVPGRQDADGFGDAIPFSPMSPPPPPAAPIVGVAGYPATGIGYWTVDAAGGVFTVADAPFFGSASNVRLQSPITGITPTTTGQGYWLVGADGGVFTFGDAYFAGSGVGDPDRSRVVGIVPFGFHTARGYLLAHAAGKVVEYGPAGASVRNPALRLNAPVVGIAVTPSEAGYYLAAADGGVFTFGDARFGGSLGALTLAKPIRGIDVRFDGGYWLVGADGGVFSFGGAPFFGSEPSQTPGGLPTVGIAATPDPLAPRQ
jgi:hypothetical protein